MSRLLLIGSGSVHTQKYLGLVADYFEKVRLITDKEMDTPANTELVHGDFTLINPLKALQNVVHIKKHINSFSPGIIHVQQANSTAWLTISASRHTNIPVVVTAWGSDVLLLPGRSAIYKKMVQSVLRRADYLTADACHMVNRMEQLCPGAKNKAMVANFGIEPFYLNTPKEKIIYSNRLHKKLYRIDRIIREFRLFTARGHMDWRLIIAGEGEETDNLKKLTMDLGLSALIEFTGWLGQEENQTLYGKAAVFVSVPESDATAISLLEAMHAGCVPVVSDLPAAREWITDGLNGVVVTLPEVNIFERALLPDPEKVASINKKIINEKGLKSVNREKFLGLYKKILL